jgi:hypothetical protein
MMEADAVDSEPGHPSGDLLSVRWVGKLPPKAMLTPKKRMRSLPDVQVAVSRHHEIHFHPRVDEDERQGL